MCLCCSMRKATSVPNDKKAAVAAAAAAEKTKGTKSITSFFNKAPVATV